MSSDSQPLFGTDTFSKGDLKVITKALIVYGNDNIVDPLRALVQRLESASQTFADVLPSSRFDSISIDDDERPEPFATSEGLWVVNSGPLEGLVWHFSTDDPGAIVVVGTKSLGDCVTSDLAKTARSTLARYFKLDISCHIACPFEHKLHVRHYTGLACSMWPETPLFWIASGGPFKGAVFIMREDDSRKHSLVGYAPSPVDILRRELTPEQIKAVETYTSSHGLSFEICHFEPM